MKEEQLIDKQIKEIKSAFKKQRKKIDIMEKEAIGMARLNYAKSGLDKVDTNFDLPEEIPMFKGTMKQLENL